MTAKSGGRNNQHDILYNVICSYICNIYIHYIHIYSLHITMHEPMYWLPSCIKHGIGAGLELAPDSGKWRAIIRATETRFDEQTSFMPIFIVKFFQKVLSLLEFTSLLASWVWPLVCQHMNDNATIRKLIHTLGVVLPS